MLRNLLICVVSVFVVLVSTGIASAVNPLPAHAVRTPEPPKVIYVEKDRDRYREPDYRYRDFDYPRYVDRPYHHDYYHRRYPATGYPIFINGYPMPWDYMPRLTHDEAATRAACQARLRQLREDVKKNLYEKGTPEEQYKQKIEVKKFEWESQGEAQYLRSIGISDRELREGWRIWQTRGGHLTVKAQYLGIQYGQVHLQKENGERFN